MQDDLVVTGNWGSLSEPAKAPETAPEKPETTPQAGNAAAEPKTAAPEDPEVLGDLDIPAEDVPGSPEADGEADGEAAPPAPKPTGRAQQRIRELANRNRDLEARLGAVDARLAELQSALTKTREPGSDTPQLPDPSKFNEGVFDPGYTAALQEYLDRSTEARVKDLLASSQRQAAEQAAQAAEAQRTEALRNAARDYIESGKEQYPDFEDVIMAVPVSPLLAETILRAENGVEIGYALAKNPKAAAKLAAMHPLEQIRYITQQDLQVSERKKAARTTKAGAPPTVRPAGSGGRASTRLDTDDFSAFKKAYDAEVSRSRR